MQRHCWAYTPEASCRMLHSAQTIICTCRSKLTVPVHPQDSGLFTPLKTHVSTTYLFWANICLSIVKLLTAMQTDVSVQKKNCHMYNNCTDMRSDTNSLTFGDQCLYSHLLVSSGSSQSQIIETYANEAVSTATDIQNAIIMK